MKKIKPLVLPVVMLFAIGITTLRAHENTSAASASATRETVEVDQCSEEVTNECARIAVDAFNGCMGIFGNTGLCNLVSHNAACTCVSQHACNSVWECNDN